MAFDTSPTPAQTPPSAEEIRKTKEVRDALKPLIDLRIKEFKEFTKTDLYEKVSRSMADWLNRELRNYAATKTPKARSAISMVFDHVTGDIVLKAFQLQTLERLGKLYQEDANFQWFINSSFPTLALVGHSNPIGLNFPLFEPGPEGTVQDTDPEAVSRLNTKERVAHSTVSPSVGGFYYLNRRPWLTQYLLAILYYRRYYPLQWLVNEMKEFRGVDGSPKQDLPNPDNLSTDIPFPVATNMPNGLPVLNNLG